MNYKKIILGTFFLALFGVIFALHSTSEAATTPWWNSAWSYRAPITITETSGSSLTNYQVAITVSYSAKMKSDFSDIRFVSSDNATELPYWRQTYSGTSATFWVEVPSVPALGTASIYMYYGNSTAQTTSNIHNTFLWGDDFENATWTSNNIHQVNYSGSTQYVQGGLYYMQGAGASEPIAEIYQNGSLKSFPNNYIAEVDVKPIIKAGSAFINPRYNSVTDKYESLMDIKYNAAGVNKVVNDSWATLQWNPVNFTINVGTTYKLKAVTLREGATNRLQVYINDVMYVNLTDSSLSYPGLAFLTYDWQNPFEVTYDNFRVHQYASKEPTSLIGAEQHP